MTIALAISYILLWLIVIFQGLVIIGLIKVVGNMARKAGVTDTFTEGPELLLGKAAPAFWIHDINGVNQGIHRNGSARMVTLLFVSPSCPLCKQALSNADSYAIKTRDNLLIVCQCTIDHARRISNDYQLKYPIIPDESGDIFDLYSINKLPVAIQISSDGTVLAIGHEYDTTPMAI